MKKLRIVPLFLFALIIFSSLVFIQIAWSATTDFTQAITEGTLSVDIVDASGETVVSPGVAFEEKAFSFEAQNATGTLGTSAERIRLSNPTATAVWTVTMAATGGTGATWTAGSFTYPYNAAAADDGRLTVNPSVGTIAGVAGCATTNVTKGDSAYFVGEGTVNVTLMSAASGAAVGCRWDLTGVALTQRIPASQAPGNYSIGMTITAN